MASGGTGRCGRLPWAAVSAALFAAAALGQETTGSGSTALRGAAALSGAGPEAAPQSAPVATLPAGVGGPGVEPRNDTDAVLDVDADEGLPGGWGEAAQFAEEARLRSSWGSCAQYGCHGNYHSWMKCQCYWQCWGHGNCCGDYKAVCSPKPAPTTQPPTRPPTPAPTTQPPTPAPTPAPTTPPPTPAPTPAPTTQPPTPAPTPAPPTAPPPTPTPAPPTPSAVPTPVDPMVPSPPVHNIKTLYHQTGWEAGPLILKNGFRPGSQGWCGGGIYFAETAQQTDTKAIGPNSSKGFMIQAVVDVGIVKEMPPTCDRDMKGATLWAQHYDSISFDPGDGREYVLYSKDRVISVRQVNMDGTPMH